MIQGYVAKKTFDKLSGAGQRREESVSEYKRRIRNRRAAMGGLAIMTALGAFAGAHNGKADQIHYSVEAPAEAKVTYVDRNSSKISIIAFNAIVGGVKTKAVDPNRPLGGAVVLDLWRELTLNNYGVKGSFCMDAGSRQIAKIEEPDGRIHYRVEVNPERDMYVCSQEDKSITPDEPIDGSLNALIGDGLTNVERKLVKDSAEAKKQNAIWAKLGQVARTVAEITVNKKCAPIIFKAIEPDAKRLIADGFRREKDEQIDVAFTANADGEVKITGQSDLDKISEQYKAEGIDITAIGDAGECTLPASVAGGKDERPQQN